MTRSARVGERILSHLRRQESALCAPLWEVSTCSHIRRSPSFLFLIELNDQLHGRQNDFQSGGPGHECRDKRRENLKMYYFMKEVGRGSAPARPPASTPLN